jgi:serine phosphatase RsbU (regulator of sigma subunit)
MSDPTDDAREMAIAREVQNRLLPEPPRLENLDLAARCVQARSVGGDFYDFFELGQGQTGLVLADVSGKGFHAALLMVALQAHLRSQVSAAPRDPLRALRLVNEQLLRSTDPGHFATLFLGVYSDTLRRLSYINCGHNPPLCLRADGRVEWLEATATVIGAFEDWQCALDRTPLAAGDTLIVYSDGVTEARRDAEHFGEDRLLAVVREHATCPSHEVVAALLERVRAFTGDKQTDDLTVMVARGR